MRAMCDQRPTATRTISLEPPLWSRAWLACPAVRYWPSSCFLHFKPLRTIWTWSCHRGYLCHLLVILFVQLLILIEEPEHRWFVNVLDLVQRVMWSNRTFLLGLVGHKLSSHHLKHAFDILVYYPFDSELLHHKLLIHCLTSNSWVRGWWCSGPCWTNSSVLRSLPAYNVGFSWLWLISPCQKP